MVKSFLWKAREPKFDSLKCSLKRQSMHSALLVLERLRRETAWRLLARQFNQIASSGFSKNPVSKTVERDGGRPWRVPSGFRMRTRVHIHVHTCIPTPNRH